jgi:hypothetical protein
MAPTKDLIMLMVVGWLSFCSTRTRSVFVWFGIETASGSGLGGGRVAARRQGLLCDPKFRHWMDVDGCCSSWKANDVWGNPTRPGSAANHAAINQDGEAGAGQPWWTTDGDGDGWWATEKW